MKRIIITISIILGIIILSAIILNSPKQEVSEEIAKCIGENSIMYVQLGCHACEISEDLFGENIQYLNTVDCFAEREKCIEEKIEKTPTWIINNQKIEGVQSLETLKYLTGC